MGRYPSDGTAALKDTLSLEKRQKEHIRKMKSSWYGKAEKIFFLRKRGNRKVFHKGKSVGIITC